MDRPFKQGLADLGNNVSAILNRTIVGIQNIYFKKI